MAQTVDPRLAANICKQCGQSQVAPDPNDPSVLVQAPMLHYGQDSYHVDCLSFELELLHRPQHTAVIDAAKAGVRGEELHAVAHQAAARFQELEVKWLEEHAAANTTGEVDPNPVHAMYTQDGE